MVQLDRDGPPHGAPGAEQPGINPVNERELASLLHRKIGDFLEPITRFDRSKLVPVGSAARPTPFCAIQAFEVSFTTRNLETTGRLPMGTTRTGNAAQLAQAVESILGRAYADLPRRLAAWDAASRGAPSALLGSGDCFDQPPPVGFDYACSSCSGVGRTTCSGCSGRRQVDCMACLGKGKTGCHVCGSKGYATCPSCNGSGTYWQSEPRTITDYSTNSTHTEYVQVLQRCNRCGPSGRQNCESCGATGKRTCFCCSGMGRVNCASCQGTGEQFCFPCAGSGWRNTTATVSCQVVKSSAIEPVTNDEEIKRTLTAWSSVESLCALSGPIAYSSRVHGPRLERRFAGTVPVTVLGLNVEQEVISIYGFGTSAEVRDFKNVAGALLRGDLGRLDRALAARPRSAGVQSDLRTALAQCLASEANVRIAEESARGQAHLARLVRGELRYSISDAYAVEAGRSIRTALGRVFRAETSYPALAMVILLAIVAQVVGVVATGWSEVQLLAIAWVISAICGGAAGWAKTARLKRRFDPPVRDKLVPLLRRLGIIRRAALWTGGLVLAASLGAFVLIPRVTWDSPLTGTWSCTMKVTHKLDDPRGLPVDTGRSALTVSPGPLGRVLVVDTAMGQECQLMFRGGKSGSQATLLRSAPCSSRGYSYSATRGELRLSDARLGGELEWRIEAAPRGIRINGTIHTVEDCQLLRGSRL